TATSGGSSSPDPCARASSMKTAMAERTGWSTNVVNCSSMPKVSCMRAKKSSDRPTSLRPNRLDARFLVIGDDHRRLILPLSGGLLEEGNFAVDTQHLCHLLLELAVTAFEVVADLVRLHGLPVEDLAHRSLDKSCQAVMPRRRSVFPGMAGQEPCCPQLMRI